MSKKKTLTSEADRFVVELLLLKSQHFYGVVTRSSANLTRNKYYHEMILI